MNISLPTFFNEYMCSTQINKSHAWVYAYSAWLDVQLVCAGFAPASGSANFLMSWLLFGVSVAPGSASAFALRLPSLGNARVRVSLLPFRTHRYIVSFSSIGLHPIKTRVGVFVSSKETCYTACFLITVAVSFCARQR